MNILVVEKEKHANLKNITCGTLKEKDIWQKHINNILEVKNQDIHIQSQKERLEKQEDKILYKFKDFYIILYKIK